MAEALQCQLGRRALCKELRDTPTSELSAAFQVLLGYPLPVPNNDTGTEAEQIEQRRVYGTWLRCSLVERSKKLMNVKMLQPFYATFIFATDNTGKPAPLAESGHSARCTHPRCRQKLWPWWWGNKAKMRQLDAQNYPEERKTPSIVLRYDDGEEVTVTRALEPGRVTPKRFHEIANALIRSLDSRVFEPGLGYALSSLSSHLARLSWVVPYHSCGMLVKIRLLIGKSLRLKLVPPETCARTLGLPPRSSLPANSSLM
jgi:hypothetical protein